MHNFTGCHENLGYVPTLPTILWRAPCTCEKTHFSTNLKKANKKLTMQSKELFDVKSVDDILKMVKI